MSAEGLPPGPNLRSWYGSRISLHSIYSVAGISTSFFAVTPSGILVLEAGDGCTRDLIELRRALNTDDDGVDPENGLESITGVVISHPHYDHYSGLLNLLNLFHILGRKEDLAVIYPEGSMAVESMLEHFYDTLWEKCPFSIIRIPVDGAAEMDLNGIRISSIPVIHRNSRPGAVGEEVPSMAYSIAVDSERITYTGDTCGSGELDKFIEGSDLALIECTFDITPQGHEEVHMDIEKALNTARGAMAYWLVHFTSRSFLTLSGMTDILEEALPKVPTAGKP
jgi:ribonuclease BN (tRNA processing enzyme)